MILHVGNKMSATNEIEQASIKSLNHLGLVSAAIDELKIVERIDKRLPLDKSKGVELTHGQRVKAMIINGLGYTNAPLYMTSQFYEDKDTARLLGENVNSTHLNDDALGRTLDAAWSYGTTQLFGEIAFDIAIENDLLGRAMQLDTTSLIVYGDYDLDTDDAPLPTWGLSKARRGDLKQLVLSMTVNGPASLPLWFESLSGNSSDKTNFHDTIATCESFKKALKAGSKEKFVWVADSALYKENKLVKAKFHWVTRVPNTLGQVKTLLQQADNEIQWHNLNNGYKAALYSDKKQGQVWGLYWSEAMYLKSLGTLERKIDKAKEETEKSLSQLCKKRFACEKDALRAGKNWAKKLKYQQVEFTLKTIERYSKRGKPAKGAKPDRIEYQLSGELTEDKVKLAAQKERLGRFVLATNDIKTTGKSAKSLLSAYKEQKHVERGFGFMKSDEFQLDHIYLKSPRRIDALMMIMTLTLLVYNSAQYQMREAMKAQNIMLPNQKGKEVSKVTLRWVFKMMQGVHTLYTPDKTHVTGKNEVRERIIRLFGPTACKIYDIKS